MSSDIGFAEISEIYRNERRSKTLTKIPPDFYEKAAGYLASLEHSYSEPGTSPSSAQAMMLQDEIKKVKKRMEQIYGNRERKISLAALTGSCGGEPPKHMTGTEKQLYQNLVDVLKHYRECPSGSGQPEAITGLAKEEKRIAAKPEIALKEEPPEEEKKIVAVLRVLEDVPAFAGADRTYNLKKADVVTLPANFAEVLVSRGVAKIIDG